MVSGASPEVRSKFRSLGPGSPRARIASPAAGALSLLALAIAGKGCGGSGEPLPVDAGPAPTEPRCEATVSGHGEVDVERRYLPRVVACENAAGGIEALKAQAVAARSYLYYRKDSAGAIGDGTRDQVYTCQRRPTRKHRRAVRATEGQILTYGDELVAGFFVAGAEPEDSPCVGDGPDRFNTEDFVTYNRGQRGDWVEQTTLGIRDSANLANRGAMSQHGANCLADEGWRYDEILRYYYGGDIEIAQVDACEPTSGWRGGPALLSRDRVVGGAVVFALWILVLAIAGWRREANAAARER